MEIGTARIGLMRLSEVKLNQLMEILKMELEVRTPEEIQTIANFYQKYKIFSVATDRQQLYYMASVSRYLIVEKGGFIFHEGDEGNRFYVILKGRVVGLINRKDTTLSKYFVDEKII